MTPTTIAIVLLCAALVASVSARDFQYAEQKELEIEAFATAGNPSIELDIYCKK